ncbi:class B sortase [uncultured Ruminococcus sp.]|uniref:class B sortase n=1 Tax=uncultured Ruminococcus sp. TaxID=165186 RepID=UPI002612E4C4|nr:class B sortase [uncultured Ruminococcus sp.]
MSPKKLRKKQAILIAVSLVLAVIILISAVCLRASRYIGSGESHLMDAIRSLGGRSSVSSVEDTDTLRRRQTMLEEGIASYPDMKGWLVIPETSIDYPVMYSEDEDYYIDHSYDQKDDVYGTPFLYSGNAPDFSDFVSIVYGHDMNNGTMFGSLRSFQKTSQFQDVPQGYLILEDGLHLLTIVASLSGDAETEKLLEESTSGVDDTDAFLNTLLTNAKQQREVELTEDDRLLVLSTLEYDKNEKQSRSLLIAKYGSAEE